MKSSRRRNERKTTGGSSYECSGTWTIFHELPVLRKVGHHQRRHRPRPTFKEAAAEEVGAPKEVGGEELAPKEVSAKEVAATEVSSKEVAAKEVAANKLVANKVRRFPPVNTVGLVRGRERE